MGSRGSNNFCSHFFFLSSGSIYQVPPRGRGFVLCFMPIILFSQSLQHGERCCYYLHCSWGIWSSEFKWPLRLPALVTGVSGEHSGLSGPTARPLTSLSVSWMSHSDCRVLFRWTQETMLIKKKKFLPWDEIERDYWQRVSFNCGQAPLPKKALTFGIPCPFFAWPIFSSTPTKWFYWCI